MEITRNVLIAGTLAASTSLMPAMVGATETERSGTYGPRASSALTDIGLGSLEAMSDRELDDVLGGRRWGRRGFFSAFNIAIAPQINICIICQGVNQSNFAFLLGFNGMP